MIDTKACKYKKIKEVAERVGFEPTVRFPVRSLSRRVLSTAQSPLRGRCKFNRSRALRFSANGHSDHVTMKNMRTCARLPINLLREWKDAGVNGVQRRRIGGERRSQQQGRQRSLLLGGL